MFSVQLLGNSIADKFEKLKKNKTVAVVETSRFVRRRGSHSV
jgi:hypothetical protein